MARFTNLISTQLPLETPRLELRPLAQTDCASLFRLYSDPDVVRFSSALPWTSHDDAAKYIAIAEDQMLKGRSLRLGIVRRNDTEFLGACSLFNISDEHARAEVGYALMPMLSGNGYMHESLTAMLGLAFKSKCFKRIEADVDPKNQASVRTLQRLGFTFEGVLRDRWNGLEGRSDSAMYALLAPEWRG